MLFLACLSDGGAKIAHVYWYTLASPAVLAGLIIALFAWLRADLAAHRKETAEQFAGHRKEISGLRNEMFEQFAELRADYGALRERMARLEGLLQGLREAITERKAA